MCKRVQFTISTYIEQAARSIVRSCGEGVAIREKSINDYELVWHNHMTIHLLHSIDIWFVAGERLCRPTAPDVPELRRCVTGTRYENVLVRAEREAVQQTCSWTIHSSNHGYIPHNITGMVTKFEHSHSGFNIPEHACHVTRAGDDLSIVDESTATEITRVCTQLASTSGTCTVLVV